MSEVEALAFAQNLSSGQTPFIVDVREPWEWAVSNLSDRGARLIPLAELDERMSEIPTGRPIVVYCRTGQRSLMAARTIASSGRTPVASLKGGITAWARDVEPGMPVV